jgi:hypothetical protein
MQKWQVWNQNERKPHIRIGWIAQINECQFQPKDLLWIIIMFLLNMHIVECVISDKCYNPHNYNCVFKMFEQIVPL